MAACEICGAVDRLDQHHVEARRMGGSHASAINDASNLLTLCRRCHQNIHEGHWSIERRFGSLRVLDTASGSQVMRRLKNDEIDAPGLLHLLDHALTSIECLLEALRFLTDEQLIEAFGSARGFGKKAWLVQAAILREAQARSIHGDQALAAVARRFDVSLRQAEKYATVWQTFFAEHEGEQKNVNIDEFALQEPSWYVVAASETNAPHAWLAYAQDRKLEDSRYTVAALRRDIRAARLHESVGEAREARQLISGSELVRWACPWIRIYCTRTGRPVAVDACDGCEEPKQEKCETKPM